MQIPIFINKGNPCLETNLEADTHVNLETNVVDLMGERDNHKKGGQFGDHQYGGQNHGGGNSVPGNFLGGGVQDDRPCEEELKPVTITLPKLPDFGGKNQGLEAGDWMAQIRPQIADVSHRAMWWWDTLETMTTQRYQQWLGSDPITRLNVQPPSVAELPHGLGASKEFGFRDDCESRAGCSSDHLQGDEGLPAWRIGERQNTLQALTTTQTAGTSLEASTSLKMWHRHYTRAGELSATLPDPTLMIGTLDRIMSKLLQ